MRFLNGWKTVLGVAGTLAGVLLPKVHPDVVSGVLGSADNVVVGAFTMLTLLGVIHKAEKRK